MIDQCEYASDVLFTDRAALETIQGDLVTAAVTALGATDVLHFLGRKPHPAFAGEVTIDSKKRAQGCRVRFRLKANAVKFYDHANVFRVETTINNPREFKVLRSADRDDQEPRWCPMTKGVANFWRYAEVAHAANGRLLTALARVPLTGEATAELDALCQPVTATGARVPPSTRSTRTPPTCSPRCCPATSPSTGSATGTSRANSTLPRPQTSRTPSGGPIAPHA